MTNEQQRVEATILQDREGNYYLIPQEAMDQFRVPADRREELENALRAGDVSGFGSFFSSGQRRGFGSGFAFGFNAIAPLDDATGQPTTTPAVIGMRAYVGLDPARFAPAEG